MSLPLQQSLLDGPGDPELAPLTGIRRLPLSETAWLDLLPGWLSGADELFAHLSESVPWRAERRRMYDGIVAVPRLLAFYREGAPLPHPILTAARDALTQHYKVPFTTAGLCYYRDGRDSVAWHGDRIGRGATQDTHVAILSVGAPRPLLLRPRGGGPTTRHPQGHGDLLVMGGDCQRAWDHAIPKTTKPVGPRISIQFRPSGVR
ncbi:alpha-ketoglutarate-dependent dioxygenase AlkB [Actinokineospora sp. NPDC004072]